MMMAQVTAAALVAEMRVLASPASTGSIPTSGNQEDFVSMGMTSALKLEQSVDLARMVIAIELLGGGAGAGSSRRYESQRFWRMRAPGFGSEFRRGRKIACSPFGWKRPRSFWRMMDGRVRVAGC